MPGIDGADQELPLRTGRPGPVSRFTRIWKSGPGAAPAGPVHVSMNDYLIHRLRDIPRVAIAGLRLRRSWPATEGALGLWFASTGIGRRQVSVSIWESPEDLKRFVRSPAHRAVTHGFRNAGDLHTNAWTAEAFDRSLIWRQAEDRLLGRLPEVTHH